MMVASESADTWPPTWTTTALAPRRCAVPSNKGT